jgi:GT2 family glycosyltransferase
LKNPKTGKRWKVYMGLPSNGTVVDFQSYMLRELQSRYEDEIEFVYPDQLCQRIFHDYAREGIVQDFLATDCDILWMMDSDIVPPKHVLDLVTMHGDKWEVAGAPYPIFMAQPGESQRMVVITAYKQMEPHPETKKPRIAPCAVPDEGLDFVDGLATGCLFIKREVFDRLERPYFEFKYDPITRQPIEGEDIGFCLKMLKLGVKFFTDYSMVCKHYKNNLDLLEINNYAVALCNKHIEVYRREMDKVRGQLEEVAQRFQKLAAENKALKEHIAALPKVNKSGLVARDGSPLIYR